MVTMQFRIPLLAGVGLLGSLLGLAYAKNDWKAPEDAKTVKNPVAADDASIAAGKDIYADRCANCHGEKGDGKGEDATQYSVAPAVFNDAGAMRETTDGELFWKISEGRRPMPGFKSRLTEQERWQVVNYIRTFAKPAAAPPPAPANSGRKKP
jgi:mono/diheme cytochrome c family protein